MTTEQLKTRAAQTFLKEEGYYKGEIDGDWGPLSRGAAWAWWQNKHLTADGTPYQLAQAYIGTAEIPGPEHNPLIVSWIQTVDPRIRNDETAWCAAFVNAMCEYTGYEETNQLNARSFLDIGETIAASQAQPGDIVIFWRGSPDDWRGHVGFYVGEVGDYIKVLGGNQSNAVNISTYPKYRLLGVRRLQKVTR